MVRLVKNGHEENPCYKDWIMGSQHKYHHGSIANTIDREIFVSIEIEDNIHFDFDRFA